MNIYASGFLIISGGTLSLNGQKVFLGHGGGPQARLGRAGAWKAKLSKPLFGRGAKAAGRPFLQRLLPL